MHCVVVFKEHNLIWAKPVDTYSNEDKFIYIDTSYSPANLNNNAYRDIPIGTFFTYLRGLINPINR